MSSAEHKKFKNISNCINDGLRMRSENNAYTRWINVRKGSSAIDSLESQSLALSLKQYPIKDIHFHGFYQHGEINLQKVFLPPKNISRSTAFLSNHFIVTKNMSMKTILYRFQHFSSLLSLVI